MRKSCQKRNPEFKLYKSNFKEIKPKEQMQLAAPKTSINA